MDLLVEKGNNKTYLSQLGFLVTSFEEGAPTIARNSTNIQGRSGSVDFGGWHESKKVKLEGFYRAEDQYEEETLKERLFALLSDPEGIYITEMRGEIGQGFERPGETEGDIYEHMMTRPSHKRFYVYASSIENELQGNVGGTVLYKTSVEFTTLKLPYGESVPRDLDIKPNVPYYGRNLLTGTKAVKTG
ncbi:phage tail domain-containing protein, partial [Klebsiella pneumoniae]